MSPKDKDVIFELVMQEMAKIVYDPFMGTGTTAVACARSNRNLKYIGSEVGAAQCEYARERIKNLEPISMSLF